MLKKKSNSICYHTICKSVAMGESLTRHIGTNENVGDLTTKVLYDGQKRQYMVSQLLYDIYNDNLNADNLLLLQSFSNLVDISARTIRKWIGKEPDECLGYPIPPVVVKRH